MLIVDINKTVLNFTGQLLNYNIREREKVLKMELLKVSKESENKRNGFLRIERLF